MYDLLARIANLFWPDLQTLDPQRRMIGVGNIFTILYTAPLVLVGTIWLIRASDFSLFQREWTLLLILAGLYILFERLKFFIIFEIRPGNYANSDSNLTGMVMWSGYLLLGPTVLWLGFLAEGVRLIWAFRKAGSQAGRWNRVRIFSLGHAANVLAPLVALSFYERIGGHFPPEGLQFADIYTAFIAIATHFILFLLIYSGYIVYILWAQKTTGPLDELKPVYSFMALAMGLPYLSYPFGILAAGIFVQNDLFSYLFFIAGIFLVALLARQFSRAAESSRQQSRQLEQLEQLGRAIITASPDASDLPETLQKHVPAMFPSGRILIWMENDQFLLRHPAEWSPKVDDFWKWIQTQDDCRAFLADTPLPWRVRASHHSPLVVAPILDGETDRPIGGIYIELQTLVQPWDRQTIAKLFPAVNALTDQIASAISQAVVYAEALELQRTAQELRIAGEIQSSFFPDHIPVGPGWELAVTILPARETSGDFFDFIPLENGKLGILIADVTDKGVGPALFMALSRTLIRTYAIEYEFDPDIVFFAANGRILRDTRASLFVTAFFGILDQETGLLTYSNAGHNPPYLLRCLDGEILPLSVTGMPIGVDEETVWTKASVQIEPGDMLLLYTDGIPDAQDKEGKFFREDRLVEVAQSRMGQNAHEVQAAIVEEVQGFAGEMPQFDDMTLMVLVRQNQERAQPI